MMSGLSGLANLVENPISSLMIGNAMQQTQEASRGDKNNSLWSQVRWILSSRSGDRAGLPTLVVRGNLISWDILV